MGYNMKGSPFLKDVKKWKWNGEQIMVDDSALSPTYKDIDDFGNKTIKYNYIDEDGKKASEVLYENKPRKENKKWKGGPKTPHDRPIDPERFYT